MPLARLVFIHALSPLHAGTGQGVGVIDLPIAREKATGLPYLPGSSIKGTLRDAFTEDEAAQTAIFGPSTENAAEYAGSVQFADGRLLLLPVRSLGGTFAWVTSPYILRRFARDARTVGDTNLTALPDPPDVTTGTDSQICAVASSSRLVVSGVAKVVLEDLDLNPVVSDALDVWSERFAAVLFAGEPDAAFWSEALRAQICVVSDELLSFLLTTATEVIARVKLLDDTKTVQQGGLWYEEALPAETILTSLIIVNPTAEKRHVMSEEQMVQSLAHVTTETVQFGGKATVGRGLCRVRLQGV